MEIGAGSIRPEKMAAYFAIEYSPVGARLLRGKGVKIARADGLSLPFESGSFDTVACHDVLEHVLDPERFLSEMTRVSRDKVIIVGPNYVGPNRKRNGKLQPTWLPFLGCLLGQHRRVHLLKRPYFSFDERWENDADAVVGVNVWWVTHQLERHGFKRLAWRTSDYASIGDRWAKLPFYDVLGFMMFLVAQRG